MALEQVSGGGHCHLCLQLGCLLVACLLLLPAPAASGAAATVVTHLPGFDGALPFYLETGYVNVEEAGAELFYYFVESERDPGGDAVLLWLTGGPRCSGYTGLGFEVGPTKFVLEPYNGSLPQLVYNPYSWTQYGKHPSWILPSGPVSRMHVIPKAMMLGLLIIFASCYISKEWFDDHPRYISNPFYIGGDSYAGKVIPLIAQYMSEGMEQRQRPHINLKGYLVGNPITDRKFDQNFVVPTSHGFGLISDQLYEAAVEHCKGDYVNPANDVCSGVLHTINNLISEVPQGHILYKLCVVAALKPTDYDDSRRFLFEEDIRLSEPPGHPAIDCFMQTYGYYLAYFWMNDNATREALGIKKGTIGEWIRCIKGLPYAEDLPSSIDYHYNLTTKGYRALVYSGDHDLTVPFLGTQAWIRSLNFSIVDDWRAWHVDGQAAGLKVI
ncbi:hypothetical protein ACP4OV_026568 [Aristida adscensionis]